MKDKIHGIYQQAGIQEDQLVLMDVELLRGDNRLQISLWEKELVSDDIKESFQQGLCALLENFEVAFIYNGKGISSSAPASSKKVIHR